MTTPVICEFIKLERGTKGHDDYQVRFGQVLVELPQEVLDHIDDMKADGWRVSRLKAAHVQGPWSEPWEKP